MSASAELSQVGELGRKGQGKMQVTGEITAIERENNSFNGNPAYSITMRTDDGMRTFRTSSDASCAYEVGNPGRRVGSEVTLQLTNAGYIAYITDKRIS